MYVLLRMHYSIFSAIKLFLVSRKIPNQPCEILLSDGFFLLQNNLNNLDPTYKMDLDCWDCFGRGKTLSYNQTNKL